MWTGNQKPEFVDLWNEISDRNVKLYLGDWTLSQLLSRNWVDIAVSYVKKAWTQLLLSTNTKDCENLQRSCVVSAIFAFLFEVGISIEKKDKILHEFLEKIELSYFGGIFTQFGWNYAFREYLQRQIQIIEETEFLVRLKHEFLIVFQCWICYCFVYFFILL